MMQLYKTTKGIVLKNETRSFLLQRDFNELINRDELFAYLAQLVKQEKNISKEESDELINDCIQAPIQNQEVWAAGVTYLRSRDARMEESAGSGGADCYQKVYEAERPELFFKSLSHRVAGPGQQVYIRKDSTWNVPEPELTLYINSSGRIQAYTIGNDMSSRSIEGENPLYLPQAKVYERSAALGPCLFVTHSPIDQETQIRMVIHRGNEKMFEDSTPLSRMKRSLPELASWLFKACDFTDGCFLMTGTCLVPPNDFTLAENDVVDIYIDGIGRLTNTVASR